MTKKLVLVFILTFALAGVAFGQDVPLSSGEPSDTSGQVQPGSKCVVNGVEVPCDQVLNKVAKGVGTFFGLSMAFFATAFAVGILASIFWIMMLVHAIKNPIENKVLWLLLILLTGIIGSIVYYFAVKRHFRGQTGSQATSFVPPNNPPNMPPSNMG